MSARVCLAPTEALLGRLTQSSQIAAVVSGVRTVVGALQVLQKTREVLSMRESTLCSG